MFLVAQVNAPENRSHDDMRVNELIALARDRRAKGQFAGARNGPRSSSRNRNAPQTPQTSHGGRKDKFSAIRSPHRSTAGITRCERFRVAARDSRHKQVSKITAGASSHERHVRPIRREGGVAVNLLLGW